MHALVRFSRPFHASQNAKFLTDNSLTHLAVSHHYIQASVDAACHNGHVPVLPAQNLQSQPQDYYN